MDGVADYTFVRSLGAGSNGQMYLAESPPRLRIDDDFVAVKVVSSPSDEASLRRTTRELRAFAAVRSPYLVRVYDAGRDGDLFFLAMEYLPMGSLAAPGRPLDRDEVLRAVSCAARAAHDLHEAGLSHGSISPANILVADDGGRLGDLGLARTMSPGQSITGLGSVTSLEFIDPAILRGEHGSRATDIWSLAATLHRVTAGRGLFGELPEAEPLVGLRRVLNTAPEVAPDLDAGIADVVRRAVSDGDRPPTAADFADLVDALAA